MIFLIIYFAIALATLMLHIYLMKNVLKLKYYAYSLLASIFWLPIFCGIVLISLIHGLQEAEQRGLEKHKM